MVFFYNRAVIEGELTLPFMKPLYCDRQMVYPINLLSFAQKMLVTRIPWIRAINPKGFRNRSTHCAQ